MRFCPAPLLISASLFFMATGIAAQVVINEVYVSPPNSSGSTTNVNSLYNTDPADQPPYNSEWIELYNTHPCDTFDLSCHTLASNMQPPSGAGYDNWGAFTFPQGTKIPPMGFIIIGGNASMVPQLDFNITAYRQAGLGISGLSGDYSRWFLRDEYGWIALYDPSGQPLDAVYWDIYGLPANLSVQSEYASAVSTSTSCSGYQSYSAARNIAGIEYAGKVIPATHQSLQRTEDGAASWYSTAVSFTPRTCNGDCAGPPEVSCNITDESCAGGDGALSVNIVDGHTGPYTIQWIYPVVSGAPSLTGLTSGTYIVSVTDAYNCFVVYDTVTLSQLSGPTILVDQVAHESCNASNGSISLVAGGNNLPFQYAWSSQPSQNSPLLQNLSAGTYSVTVTDNLGCTATASAVIVNQAGPEAGISQIQNEMCSAADAQIITWVSGGTPPLSYAWNSSPSQTTQNLTGVHAGSYTLTVTDANGCNAFADTVLTDTPPPVINFMNVSDETCHMSNGTATLHISGGHPPYTFIWADFPGLEDTTLVNLHEGNFMVSVSDSFCTLTSVLQIRNIPGPTAGFRVYPDVATIEDPRIIFYDESFGATEWHWDFGDWSYSTAQSPVHLYADTGIFRVRQMIFNDEGCMDSVSHTVLIMDPITLFIPNAFTPNSDGVNDFFNAFGNHIADFEMRIFNRWGEEVFSCNNMTVGWDGNYQGRAAPDGVYTWIIWYKEDYITRQMDRKSIQGHLSLLR